MKKLSIILALLIATPAFAEDTVETASTSRDNYVGIRLHKNENIEFEYDMGINEVNIVDDQFGFGAVIGNKLSDNFKIEFETSYTGTNFKLGDLTHDYDLWSNMVNMYMFTEFFDAIEPYVGIGLGFTGIFADVNTSIGHIKDTSFDLTWQFMVGVNIPLNDRIDVNLGFKYVNYGDIDHTRSNIVLASTDIDATEFYMGAVYKFGL